MSKEGDETREIKEAPRSEEMQRPAVRCPGLRQGAPNAKKADKNAARRPAKAMRQARAAGKKPKTGSHRETKLEPNTSRNCKKVSPQTSKKNGSLKNFGRRPIEKPGSPGRAIFFF